MVVKVDAGDRGAQEPRLQAVDREARVEKQDGAATPEPSARKREAGEA
jgi:hypothetical protein